MNDSAAEMRGTKRERLLHEVARSLRLAEDESPARSRVHEAMTSGACELEPGSDEEREFRGIWLSALMFGWMVGMPESRPYEEWLAAQGLVLA